LPRTAYKTILRGETVGGLDDLLGDKCRLIDDCD
jgi:hypothetical protein